MGVSINGFATKADKKEAIFQLEKACQKIDSNAKIEYERDAIFEELIQRKREDNIIDIYSTNNGSILIMSHQLFEKFSRWELSKAYDIDYFDINETSMSHRFAKFSQGKETVCMNIWDSGSSKKIAGDNYLEIEQDEDVFFSAFQRLADLYTENTFHEIELDTRIERYRFIILAEVEKTSEVETTKDASVVNEKKSKKEKKSFWSRLFSK